MSATADRVAMTARNDGAANGLLRDLAAALGLPGIDAEAQPAQGHRFEVEILTGEEVAPLAAAYNAVPFEILELPMPSPVSSTATRKLYYAGCSTLAI